MRRSDLVRMIPVGAALLAGCPNTNPAVLPPTADTGAARDVRDVVTAADRVVARDVTTSDDVPTVDDVVEPVDTPVAPMDRVNPADVVALDTPARPDVVTVTDVVAPIDLPAVTLGDAYSTERDAGDPTPRDVDMVTPGAPADSAMRFGGADTPARAPTIVYPDDATILPPNLTGFEVHFRPAAGTDLFEVSFRGDRGLLRVYTTCARVSDGCVYAMNGAAYAELARVAQSSGNVTLTVRATSMSGGGVGRAATRSLGVTNFDVRGGLYYWSAASGTILRYEFGLPDARPEAYLRGDPINCLGCHVLSRDGSRAIVGRFIPSPAATRIYDVPSRAGVSSEFGANFGTFSPDLRWLLTSDGMRLTLRNAATGAEVPGLTGGTTGSHPDWSRDGRRVVISRSRTTLPFPLGTPGHDGPSDLVMLPWTGTAFGAATTLLRGDGTRSNNYYPAFSPDDAWVLFNRAMGNSNDNQDAQLWVTRADGTGTPTRLQRADRGDGLANSWPKWAPFVQRFQGEPLIWFTFASRRDYGLRLQQQTREPAMRTAQLWMAAFRPDRAAMGDASAPAFWLPFQNIGEGNHIAQWSEAVARQGCTSDRDCNPQERCLPLSQTSTIARYGCVAR